MKSYQELSNATMVTINGKHAIRRQFVLQLVEKSSGEQFMMDQKITTTGLKNLTLFASKIYGLV
jgi:hypothetical protein